MNQHRFVQLSFVAFGLVVASFVVLGLSRLLVEYRTAQLLAAPVGGAGFLLLVVLTARATLAKVGIWPIPADSNER